MCFHLFCLKLLVCPVNIQTVPSFRLLPSWKVLSCSLFKYMNEFNEFLSRSLCSFLLAYLPPSPPRILCAKFWEGSSDFPAHSLASFLFGCI